MSASHATNDALLHRPAWIDEDLARSIPLVNVRLCRGEPTPERCLCCGVPTNVLLERSPQGLEALLAHAANVERTVSRFVVTTIPHPAAYADLYLRVVVPTYNAVHIESRRCGTCGAEFVLTAPADVETLRSCPACTA